MFRDQNAEASLESASKRLKLDASPTPSSFPLADNSAAVGQNNASITAAVMQQQQEMSRMILPREQAAGVDVSRAGGYFHKFPGNTALGVGGASLHTLGIPGVLGGPMLESNGYLQQSEFPPNPLPQPNGSQQYHQYQQFQQYVQHSNNFQPRPQGAQEDARLLEPVRSFISTIVPAGKPEPDIIDLTDDADDNIVVTRAHRQMEVPKGYVCYGTITGKINANRVPAFPPGREHLPMPITTVRATNPLSLVVDVCDYREEKFGYVDLNTARALVPLIDLGAFLVEPYLNALPKQQPPADTAISSHHYFFFNVYGPATEARKVASIASQQNVIIQKPHKSYYDAGAPYMNPHIAATAPRATLSGSRLGSFAAVARTADEMRADVNKVFEGLDQAENLPEMDADPRIKTPLLKHQKQGLYFLTMKEQERNYDDDDANNTPVWRKKEKNGQPWYYHVITGQTVNKRPPDVLGGILADMMGLGKTLQILSLVVSTQERSDGFAKDPKPRQYTVRDNKEPLPPIMNAKTTLLVCPLSTISNWEEQIQAHVQDGTMKWHLYHGNKRENEPKVIAGYDLVITTYQVIASEWSKHMKDCGYVSPIQQINFFRIVLDGTPVQNRLDDLAALMKFLQLKPFDDKTVFHRYIAAPLKSADDNSLRSLRLLVDSVTLRRQKDKIDLPPRKDQMVYLQFSPAEQEIYDATAKQSLKRVDMVAKQGHIGGKNYVHILQMILRLRLICAHGRELLGDEDVADLAGLTSSDAINVDELDDEGSTNISAKQAYQIFSLMKETNEDNCSVCEKKALYKEPVLAADEGINVKAEDKGKDKESDEKERPKGSTTIGFLTACTHMLCETCIPSYTARISNNFLPGMRAVCPICTLYGRVSFFELKSEELNEYLTGANATKVTKKNDFKYRGPSTKVKALIQALLENREAGTPEDPIKSVVFSCWTSHMDLLELSFQNNGISYVRLDGSLSRAQRSAAIAQFRDMPTVEVIMVSLMAGGLGLNLTAACRVYMMEPQWNPAAEAQAIDRIHRLGQKKPVICVRYIMANSFEEKILKIQEKKNNLANMTMEQGKSSKAALAKQRLDHLKDLFNKN